MRSLARLALCNRLFTAPMIARADDEAALRHIKTVIWHPAYRP